MDLSSFGFWLLVIVGVALAIKNSNLALLVFVVSVIVGILLLSKIVSIERKQSWIEAIKSVLRHDKELVRIELRFLLVFIIALALISFSAFFSPLFFSLIGYTVSSTSNPSAFEATDLFTNAMLAAIIGYMSVELVK